MFSSRDLVQDDDALSTVTAGARTGSRPYARAMRANLPILGDLLAMLVIVVGAWFLWGWALPAIWPAGPVAFIQPGFWLFAGVAVAARCIWNILFLCPRTH